jgi:recombination associated protein RdgC
MKNPIQFKACIPVRSQALTFDLIAQMYADCEALDAAPDDISHLMVKDPSSTSWRSQGLMNVLNDIPVMCVDSGIYLMAVQFNERKLPGKVRDEHLMKLLSRFQDREGRSPGKKDYAMLREQAEFELLPKAFIGRSVVPVLFFKRKRLVLICTSSQKRADETIATMMGVMNALSPQKSPSWHFVATADNPVQAMTSVVTEDNHVQGTSYYTAGSAVLKGEGKEVIRIKDRDLGSVEVQRIFKQPYTVHELRLGHYNDPNDEEPQYNFTVTDKLVFKGFKFSKIQNDEGVDKNDLNAVFASTAWMAATTLRDTVENITTFFGGMTDAEKIEDIRQQDTADEEDDGEL